MRRRETFDDALDAAIDELRRGRSLSDVLASHPRHASELRPLIETSRSLGSAVTGVKPVPEGLAGNFTIVRAALERERMTQDHERATAGTRRGTSGRRWRLASLSLPTAVFVGAAVLGVGGAAAATVANPDLGARFVAALTPDWADNVVPSALHMGDDDGDAQSANANDHPLVPGSENEYGQGSHPAVTITGVIDDSRGNTFTLESGDETWMVQVDSGTEVSGGIVVGANATVTGAQTGEKTLHGTTISTDAPADDPAERGKPDDPGAPGGVPGNANDTGMPDDPGAGDNGYAPEEPGSDDNGRPAGENSSERRSDDGIPPTPAANALEDEPGAWGANAPPGLGEWPTASNLNAAGDSAGANGTGGSGNGGGPKDP